jgi:hypothetical protein
MPGLGRRIPHHRFDRHRFHRSALPASGRSAGDEKPLNICTLLRQTDLRQKLP